MASRDASEHKDHTSSISNVVVPAALLRTKSNDLFSRSRLNTQETAQLEDFDVQNVTNTNIGLALSRASTIDIAGLQRNRQIGPRSAANGLETINQAEALSTNADYRPVLIEMPPPARLRRGGSLNTSQLHRGQVDRNTVSRRSWVPAPVISEEPSRISEDPASYDLATPAPAMTIVDGNSSSIFQDLSTFQFPAKARRRSTFFSTNDDATRFSFEDGTNLRKLDSKGVLERTTTKQSVLRRASTALTSVASKIMPRRRMSIESVYDKAKLLQFKFERSKWFMRFFEFTVYVLLAAFVYLVLVGRPLWGGLVWYIYIVIDQKFVIVGGSAIFIGLAALYAFAPLLILFEPTAKPHHIPDSVEQARPTADDTALMIPCYKSESLIAATLEAALKIFPAENIFVLANGNSATPLDDTERVCQKYGVNHTWCPIGSKIIAQYVGCYVSKKFPYVLLIDDDCLLPPNFPVVTERLKGKVKCVGYTIKSVGPNHSRGTYCQQSQDLEYKLSGIQRAFAGKIGSATFPHGAISLWDRDFLLNTFKVHPGFTVSEDWFFGHVARQLGCRITMCTSVFVETETPSSVFFSSGGARGGFGEMTVFKQRFKRWNFFFVNGIYYNMWYILSSWKLGWWEIGAKIFVFQEVYETLLYLLTPFVLPISFIVRPAYCAYLLAATFGLYFFNALIFNEVHLRMRKERVSFMCLLYYMPYKAALTFVNVLSCYWSLYKYASYFAKKHPKVIEDEKAVGVVLRIEESSMEDLQDTLPEDEAASRKDSHLYRNRTGSSRGGRRTTVTAIGVRLADIVDAQPPEQDNSEEGIQTQDFALRGLETW